MYFKFFNDFINRITHTIFQIWSQFKKSVTAPSYNGVFIKNSAKFFDLFLNPSISFTILLETVAPLFENGACTISRVIRGKNIQ